VRDGSRVPERLFAFFADSAFAPLSGHFYPVSTHENRGKNRFSCKVSALTPKGGPEKTALEGLPHAKRLSGTDPGARCTTWRWRRRSRSPRIFARLGNRLMLKRETCSGVLLQVRVRTTKMANLSAAALPGGVSLSAGNHAQGWRLSAQKLAARPVISCRPPPPRSKVDAVKVGSGMHLHGGHLRRAHVERGAWQRHASSLCSPYEDRRDRGPGHDRNGNPAPDAHPIHAVFVLSRRRTHRRHRLLHQAAAPCDQGRRRRAGGCRRHGALAQGGRRVVLDHVGLFAMGRSKTGRRKKRSACARSSSTA